MDGVREVPNLAEGGRTGHRERTRETGTQFVLSPGPILRVTYFIGRGSFRRFPVWVRSYREQFSQRTS